MKQYENYLLETEADLSRRQDLVDVRNRAFMESFVGAQEIQEQSAHIDTIGSARRLSLEKLPEDEEALYVDCQRALQEALRKNTWEYYEPLYHEFDHTSGKFKAFGRNLSDLLLNSLKVPQPEFERRRRQIEYVEEETLNYLAAGGETEGTILTISPCPEDSEADILGYVPEMDKMMLRSASFIESDGRIVKKLEQVSVKGYSRSTIEQFFLEKGVELPENWRSEDVLARQLKLTSAYSLMSVIEQLDEIEGEGRVMNEDLAMSHAQLLEESRRRKQKTERYVGELVTVAKELAEQNMPEQAANQIFYEAVERAVHKICSSNPEASLAAFDRPTYEKYYLAQQLEALGDSGNAGFVREQAKASAPSPSFCGLGGSGGRAEYSAGTPESNKPCIDLTTCPMCSDYEFDGSERKNKAKVKVLAHITESRIRCNRCEATFDKQTNQFVYKGSIHSRAKTKTKK